MKWNMSSGIERWKGLLKQYQTVLLVLAAGILLMMFPSREVKGAEQTAAQELQDQELFDMEIFEKRLSEALSEIEGAGETTVVLTLKSGSRQVLAQDLERDGERSSANTVTLGRGSSGEEAVVLQTMGPQYQGALVICPGGENPEVRLRISAAVSALTGLGSDRISICKSK